MVNASLNWASIVGLVLFVCGFLNLFLHRNTQASYDLFISVVCWLCGGILFFQGWRLDPILQFGQFLLVILTIFTGYKNMQLRKRLFKLRISSDTKIAEPIRRSEVQRDLGTKEKRFNRSIGTNSKEDLELMEDKQVYEIVKLQLLGISSGKVEPEAGEVEYLKDVLNTLEVNK